MHNAFSTTILLTPDIFGSPFLTYLAVRRQELIQYARQASDEKGGVKPKLVTDIGQD